MKHISLDLIRVTEAAAIAASKWIGSGNKIEADRAATEAMRNRLNSMEFAGRIAIGEGEKDEAPMLSVNECVGILGLPHCGCSPSAGSVGDMLTEQRPTIYDIAVDPIDGTRPTVTSGPEAISTIAVANEGSMYKTSNFYMKKLAYGPAIASKVKLDLNEPIERTINLIKFVTNKSAERITVCILDRPRHDGVIAELRALGVRVKLIQDCDVSGSIATCLPESGVDLMYGIGGAPESVLSACAIKCLGGDFQAQDVYDKVWTPAGPVLSLDRLVKGNCVFVATGVTNGSMLKGVRWGTTGPITQSVFMRSESGTIRWLEVQHGN